MIAGGAVFWKIKNGQHKVEIIPQKEAATGDESAAEPESDQPAVTEPVDAADGAQTEETASPAPAVAQPNDSPAAAKDTKDTTDAPAAADDEADAPQFKIINKLVSWGFQKASDRKIDTLIVHSSYDAIGSDPYSVSGVIAEYKSYGVSPHYLIDRQGNVYRLVEDKNIAYHAGESKMPDGRTGVNAFSVGVEILTTKSDSPTKAQYESLNGLIAYLKDKYPIKNILGHSQIAPDRKDDPWNFSWSKVKK